MTENQAGFPLSIGNARIILKMRHLCFGGSFDPVHLGHLRCAQAVADGDLPPGGFGRVVLIPAAISPLKTGDRAPPAEAGDRLAMCRLAADEENARLNRLLFEVDDLELSRPGPSYTIDTVRALRARGLTDPWWLIGADQLALLPRWREAETLLQEVNFLVVARPGWSFDFDALPAPFQALRDRVVTAPLLDISATDIRRRVAEGRSITGLVPASVERHILRRGLYRRA